MAVRLSYVVLGADIAVLVITEVLLYPTGAVVELARMDLSFPYHTGVYNSVSYTRVFKFHHDKGRLFEGALLCEPSHVYDFGRRDNCVVICKDLLNYGFLIFNVNRGCRDAIGNHSVRRHDELCAFA